jgi:hypothetical protein
MDEFMSSSPADEGAPAGVNEPRATRDEDAADHWSLKDWTDVVNWPVAVLAASAAVLIEREALWIHRRTERFEFLDGRRVRKSIELELTVPGFSTPPSPEPPALPVAQPTKRFLRSLRLFDEDGKGLIFLTRDENAVVSTTMLDLQAKETLGNPPEIPASIVADFGDIAGLRWRPDDYPDDSARTGRCELALARFRAADKAQAQPEAGSNPEVPGTTPDPTSPDPQEVRALLWADGVMRSWLLLLAERFIMFIPDLGEPGTRRKITIGYESEVAPRLDEEIARAGKSLRSRIWPVAKRLLRGDSIDHSVNLPTRGPFSARSYHAELLAPEDLTVVGARLRLVTREVDGTETSYDQLASDRSTPLVHLYANGRRPPRDTRVDAPTVETVQACVVRIRLRVRAGLVLPVFLTAAIVASALTGGLVAAILGAKSENATVAAVLVALPALYAAYLLPQGHPLMRRLFVEFRGILVVLALLPYAAAATVAIDVGSTLRYVLWSVFDVVAIACFVASSMALRRSWVKFHSTPA